MKIIKPAMVAVLAMGLLGASATASYAAPLPENGTVNARVTLDAQQLTTTSGYQS